MAAEVEGAVEQRRDGTVESAMSGFPVQIWSLKKALFRSKCRVLHVKLAYLQLSFSQRGQMLGSRVVLVVLELRMVQVGEEACAHMGVRLEQTAPPTTATK